MPLVNTEKYKTTTLNCCYCGISFKAFHWRAKAKRAFCSKPCLIAWLAKSKRDKRTVVHCNQCGKELQVIASSMKASKNHYCSHSCYENWQKQHPEILTEIIRKAWADGKIDPSVLDKMHAGLKKKGRTEEHRRHNSIALKLAYKEGRHAIAQRTEWSEITCEACGAKVQLPNKQIRATKHHFCNMECFGKWCTENRKGEINPFYHKKHTPETKAIIGQKSKDRNAVLNALHYNFSVPNKKEQQLFDILEKHFPGEWTYTGDGKIVINGLVPDFSNCNGAKAVMEMYGDYWHTGDRVHSWNRTELGRIMAYNAMGYPCLVIWEHELTDELAVVAKVEQFMKKIKSYHNKSKKGVICQR